MHPISISHDNSKHLQHQHLKKKQQTQNKWYTYRKDRNTWLDYFCISSCNIMYPPAISTWFAGSTMKFDDSPSKRNLHGYFGDVPAVFPGRSVLGAWEGQAHVAKRRIGISLELLHALGQVLDRKKIEGSMFHWVVTFQVGFVISIFLRLIYPLVILHSCGKSPFYSWESTISMVSIVMFNSYAAMVSYQRVNPIKSPQTTIFLWFSYGFTLVFLWLQWT